MFKGLLKSKNIKLKLNIIIYHNYEQIITNIFLF